MEAEFIYPFLVSCGFYRMIYIFQVKSDRPKSDSLTLTEMDIWTLFLHFHAQFSIMWTTDIELNQEDREFLNIY